MSKALLDLLVEHQVIRDDSLVASISSRSDGTIAACRVRLEVTPATAPQMAEAV